MTRVIFSILGGATLVIILAMIWVFASFEGLIKDQVSEALTPYVQGGVEIGELSFDTATGYAHVTSVRLGAENQGVTLSNLRFTLDLESMTRKNLILIKEFAVDRIVLAIEQPARLLRPAGTVNTAQIPQIALPQGVIGELMLLDHPDRTRQDVVLTEIGSAANPLTIDAFLASIFQRLFNAVSHEADPPLAEDDETHHR